MKHFVRKIEYGNGGNVSEIITRPKTGKIFSHVQIKLVILSFLISTKSLTLNFLKWDNVYVNKPIACISESNYFIKTIMTVVTDKRQR